MQSDERHINVSPKTGSLPPIHSIVEPMHIERAKEATLFGSSIPVNLLRENVIAKSEDVRTCKKRAGRPSKDDSQEQNLGILKKRIYARKYKEQVQRISY